MNNTTKWGGETMSRTKKSLKQLVADMQVRFPASGEINLELKDAKRALAVVKERYATFDAAAGALDETDGVSIEHKQWRVNVRSSNTEPVVRVNVESRGDVVLMEKMRDHVLATLKAL